MTILSQLNSPVMYLICGGIIAFVALVCVFFMVRAWRAGVAIGMTYGKTLAEACEIGAHLAASVIMTSENVCPRFQPAELGLDPEVVGT